jgi:anhydro-N-acetylmuramic acid kinase
MSGTSADGVDVAIIDCGRRGIEVVAFDTVPYPRKLKEAIFGLFDPKQATVEDICHYNFVIGEVFAGALIKVCRAKRIKLSSIYLIGSHGQTIYHIPGGRNFGGRKIRSTLQIGEPCIIARRTGITTIADFRPADIAAGGQGAPLVPFTDYILFTHKKKNRICQNIGGIANLTWLPAGGGTADVLAFDTGPGNMVIDALARIVSGGRKHYDKGGAIAARGRVNEKLLAELMANPYFKTRPPKSTGRELFGTEFAAGLYKKACKAPIEPADLIATATALTAKSIADAYARFLPARVDEVIACGGGSRNPTLMDMLARYAAPAKVIIMDELGINADAKEAVSFAILAVCTAKNISNNIPAATGAKYPAVLGKIIPAQNHEG